MRATYTLAFMLAAGAAGCALNGTPAPVVAGKIQTNWQQPAPRSVPAAAQPIAAVTPLAVPVTEQSLQTIQPAAGPRSGPSSGLNRVPNSGFTTVNVDASTSPAAPSAPTTYTVLPTDTLFKIARAHNTTPEAIIRANSLRNMADIEAGRTLTIPTNTRSTAPSLTESIANYLRTPPTSANTPIAAPIATPAATPATAEPAAAVATAPLPERFDVARIEPAAGREAAKIAPKLTLQTHTVKAGETIFRISRQYNLSVLDVMAANDLERPEALQAGMKLNIPQQPPKAERADLKAAETAAKPNLRPAAELGVVAATRATIAPTPTAAGTRPAFDADKGTDTAETIRPLRDIAPMNEKDKLRAELKRGQIDKAAANSKGLIWPARGPLMKKFGEKGNGVAHTGINIDVPTGTPVLATESGTVLYADGGLRAYGNMVLVRHSNGMVSAYAHLSHLLVRKNERVKKGQVLAMSGQSGNVGSPQLHFELRRNATAIDPLTVLPN